MPTLEQENESLEQTLRTERQIAFASGIFHGDITIRTLLESIAEGVVIIDDSGTILLVNTCAEQMFGYPAKELIGKPHAVLIPDRFCKIHEEHETGFFAEPRISPIGQILDLAGRRRDGREFPVQISLGYIETINGVFVLAFVSDISIRKEYEAHLHENEELFPIQVECVKDYAIFTLDPLGNVLNWNAGAERLRGYRAEEIIGKHFSCFYPEEDRAAGKPADDLKKAVAEGRVEKEGWRVRRDGSRFWADVIFTALYDEKGNLRGFSNVTRDITERKRLEDVLRESEERFRLMADTAPVMIWMSGTDALCTFFSKPWLVFTGRTLEEEQGNGWTEGVHPDDLPRIDAYLSAFHDRRNFQLEYRLRRADGEYRWIMDNGVPCFTANGDFTGYIGSCIDITERKRAEEELRKSELKLSKIFHSVPAIIGITTVAEGRCIDINETGLLTLGFRREEIVGRTMLEIGVWESESARNRVIRILEKEGVVRDLEINFRGKSGKAFTGIFSAEPIDFNGELYVLAMVKDITERKQMEKEIERLNTDLAKRVAELGDANSELEAFSYSVSHDLRVPLSVISGYSQLIQEVCGDTMGEKCKAYLPEIAKGVSRMTGLIDALLDFSRASRKELRREAVDLSAVAKGIVAELTQTVTERRATIRIAEGIEANCDESLVRVALANLLGNAWKYTSQQEAVLIEFGVTRVGEETAYFVRDNGPGFNMADADMLFVPFQRLEEKAEFAGHGIGLGTVERIIRRHGGRVWAEGEVGKGATFYFTLGR